MKKAGAWWIAAAAAVSLAIWGCAFSSQPTDPGLKSRRASPATAIPPIAATITPDLPRFAAPRAPTAAPLPTMRPEVAAGNTLPNLQEVESAVSQGVDIVQLPKEALDLALSEDPLVPGCASRIDGFRDCGDPDASRMVFLFGDSKAGMWAPALDEFGKENGWRVVIQTESGCTVPDFPMWSDSLKRRLTECDKFRALVVDRIKSLHPNVVLMSSNYSETIRTEKDGKPGDVVGQRSAGASGNAIWADGLATMLASMKDSTTHMVIIGNIPQRDQDPMDCLTAHASDIRWCNARRGDAFYTGLQNQATMEKTVAQQYGGTLVDTTPWFCTASYCPDTVAGKIVLRDTGHVTIQYSRWLREVLASAVGLL